MGFIGFVGVTLCFIWGMTFMPDPPPPTEGIPHNYYVPTVWGHDTINDDMLDIDMDCGDNQYIPKYESFYDVPASTDSIIIVDDILYRRGTNRWTPVYPDEYVMWVGSNGDTIWE